MRLDELDFELPDALIAQEPPLRRDGARLLTLDRITGAVEHGSVRELPDRLRAGDLLVVNETRVLPARLHAFRSDTGGRVEVFLLEPVAAPAEAWRALVRSGGSPGEGERLELMGGEGLMLVRAETEGRWIVAGESESVQALMQRHGRMPLPPYIRRRPGRDERDGMDRERYQTRFARTDGAVAAPTAGLHLSDELLATLDALGVERTAVTLHVGLGTFAPVRTETLAEHVMHAEHYEISAAAASAVQRAKAEGRRVVAVGTTTVRALEGAAARGPAGVVAAGVGSTNIFITPGYTFRVVDALLTNFHLPRSTLIALVGAFAGLDAVLAAYREAVAEGYRFYSYGDAMWIASGRAPVLG
ncbi:MAG: tRNA preQ1(34) S-adenosylmethionine ribosyltransferase-isomerase QueA [Planctomycetota bacterium]|nr:tRNA preQ1(34) S-adenosylmethionine ribosyltransferase-isomerase QueA [Planctomycetota bacterium]